MPPIWCMLLCVSVIPALLLLFLRHPTILPYIRCGCANFHCCALRNCLPCSSFFSPNFFCACTFWVVWSESVCVCAHKMVLFWSQFSSVEFSRVQLNFLWSPLNATLFLASFSSEQQQQQQQNKICFLLILKFSLPRCFSVSHWSSGEQLRWRQYF